MDIRKMAEEYEPYIIERRRYYHAHPELSFEEWETTKALEKDLSALGLTVQTFPEHPGLIATLDTGRPGKTVMLRADIDALPVKEQTGLEFASENDGVMHACGHDAHIAMLLGAAKILTALKDELCGKVRFLLQSCEEFGGGAKYCIENGCLNGVDAVFGLHIWGTLDAPCLCVDPGKRMASNDIFTVRVKGLSTHCSSPHLGHDAIVAASAIVMALQTFASRVNDPLNPFVLSIGKIHGGNIYNVICADVEIAGSVRTFSRELRGKMEGILNGIIQNTAAAYGCEAELDFDPIVPAVINDNEKLNEIAKNAALKLYGAEGVREMPSLMSAEDFSLLSEAVPGFFGFVGTRNPEKGLIYTNHNEHFTVDEDVLKRGSALAAQFAVDFMNK